MRGRCFLHFGPEKSHQPRPSLPPTPLKSETGRIRFRGVRFQTPNSVSFLGLTEFRGANFCAKANSPSFSQNSPSLPQNSVSSLLRNSTLETVFRPFPIKHWSSLRVLHNHCTIMKAGRFRRTASIRRMPQPHSSSLAAATVRV